MARSNFTKKIKFLTLFLVISLLFGTFAGCKKMPTVDNHVVGDIINYVDDIYHEVYIEQGMTDNDKGLVVGLHNSAMKILKNADVIYDGATEVGFVGGRIMGLPNKVLGSTNNTLTIVKGEKEYTLKYMYVTRAIRNVNDLSLNRDEFPTPPLYNRAEKHSDYIFEMPVASTSSAQRIPTLKIEGYYVLAANIDLGGTVDGNHNQNHKNVIHSGHQGLKSPTGNYNTEVGFTGTFDGRGHKLENLTTWGAGMFGYINGGTIKNLALIGACNYWQGQDKSIFADISKNAKFENLYVLLKQQKYDNGGVEQGQDVDGWGYAREYWAPLFSKGTIHVKDCVLESFILEGEKTKNTNYMQFLNTDTGSTYENVHCIGSSPLAIAEYDFSDGVKLMVTEKEIEEFGEELGYIEYGEIFSYKNSTTAYDKFNYIMDAIKPLIENRDPRASTEDICLVQAPAGVERYAGGFKPSIVVEKFYNAMKNDSDAVEAFMDTGCWNYDATTGALTWKNI